MSFWTTAMSCSDILEVSEHVPEFPGFPFANF